MPDNLKQSRERIDALDLEILKLVNERASTAHVIGKLKTDGTVYRPERESQVLRRLAEANRGPLSGKVVMHLFTEIISACRALEDAFSVATLGPRGTFSEEAVVKHFGGQSPIMLCASIDEVFRSVENGSVGYGIVPIENSTEGAIGRTLDLLLSTRLHLCGEVLLPVHQNLLSKGGDISSITRIYSHAQSLAQCNRWLAQHCPRAERVPVTSNAEAAKMAQEAESFAAIASKSAAAHYGLSVLADNIEDEPNNTTRFVIISSQEVAPSGKDKTSLVMSTRNVPGAIHALLTPLASNEVSMTRLESRPSRTGLWEYVFFVDMEGHQHDDHVARALKEMKQSAAFLKILGSYPIAVQ